MINSKEYYEILSIFKELIANNEIKITPESFSISAIKNILLSNDKFTQELNSLKDKLKSQNEKNKNLFSLIQHINKKKSKESKIILNSLSSSFSLFFNEPPFISSLNEKIYSSIIDNIREKKDAYKSISIVNGNFIDELFTVKAEFYNSSTISHLSPKFILDCIYECKSENLTISETSLTSSFKFKLNSHSIKSMKETFGNMISSWLTTSDEVLNAKKRRDAMSKLIAESKHIQLLEMCKGGIPNSLRKNIYIVLLNIDTTASNTVINNDNILLFDYYILRDVHRITASENYFLFEENLIRLLCLLIRDSELLLSLQGTRPILTIDINDKKIPFPPSGMFPFQGLAFQLAAFTYMSGNMNDYYLVAKNFYAKFLSYMTSYTSHKNSILTLLCDFSYAFNECDLFNDLRKHFLSFRYDINTQAIYWFMTSFATIITPENVYKLYDLIIITNNMSIFVLFALSLIYYRREELMKLVTEDDVNKSLNDICYDQINCLEVMNNLISSIN